MLVGGVAPTSGGASRAEVGGRDGDGLAAAVAPSGAPGVAGELVACSASPASVEQWRT